MIIRAKDFIENGFSHDDANKLSLEISKAIAATDSTRETIQIDFSGILYYTTLFFNQALTYLVGQWGKDRYLQRIELLNLPESGEGTYDHALQYAIDYYAQAEAERAKQDEIINKIFDES